MPGLERSTSVGLGAGGEQSFLKEPVLSEVTSTRRRVKDCCCTAGAVGLAHGLALLMSPSPYCPTARQRIRRGPSVVGGAVLRLHCHCPSVRVRLCSPGLNRPPSEPLHQVPGGAHRCI